MKLSHSCGGSLILYHDVILSLGSYFSIHDNQIRLTKHVIRGTKGSNTLLPFNEDLDVYCEGCRQEIKLKDAMVMCDDCRQFFPYKSINKFGESLAFCNFCLERQRQFLKFLIFDPDSIVEVERVNIPQEQPEVELPEALNDLLIDADEFAFERDNPDDPEDNN